MTFTLDINDVRHIDLLMELKIENEKYGRLYLPKLYLDINVKRIAELEGNCYFIITFFFFTSLKKIQLNDFFFLKHVPSKNVPY